METFALQSTASDGLGVAVTCGGEAPLTYSNSPLCFVSRWKYMAVSNPQSLSADMITKKGTVAVAKICILRSNCGSCSNVSIP
jgi:hypothetical protein